MNRGLLDISRVIASGAVVYPGDPPVLLEPLCRIGPDSPVNLTLLSCATHLLTHLDAPRHFFPAGAAIDDIGLERLMGEALVVEVEGPVVTLGHVPEDAAGLNVLFKTRHSGAWDSREYDREHVYLAEDAAAALAERGANLVGIDYLSVDRFGDESYPVHRTLLARSLLILEGLDLAAAAPGRYTLVAFPLKIAGGDGAPVRAALIDRAYPFRTTRKLSK